MSVILRMKVPGGAGEERSGGGAGLYVIAKHELLGMRLEVHLPRKVRDSVSPNVMPQQRYRDDERDELAAILFDRGAQLRL